MELKNPSVYYLNVGLYLFGVLKTFRGFKLCGVNYTPSIKKNIKCYLQDIFFRLLLTRDFHLLLLKQITRSFNGFSSYVIHRILPSLLLVVKEFCLVVMKEISMPTIECQL